MRNLVFVAKRFVFVLFGCTLFTSCKEDPVTATSISLSPTAVTMIIGEKDTLKATISPTNAPIQTVEWSSDDSTIATIDQNGIVTAVDTGSVRVWASAMDGSPVRTGCAVTVAEKTTSTETEN